MDDNHSYSVEVVSESGEEDIEESQGQSEYTNTDIDGEDSTPQLDKPSHHQHF